MTRYPKKVEYIDRNVKHARKTIQIRSSLYVCLPKEWVKANLVKKGDILIFDLDKDDLDGKITITKVLMNDENK